MKVAADSSDRLDFVKDFIEAEARPAAGWTIHIRCKSMTALSKEGAAYGEKE